MILKMYNEVKGSWVFRDNVYSVSVETDWCKHITDTGGFQIIKFLRELNLDGEIERLSCAEWNTLPESYLEKEKYIPVKNKSFILDYTKCYAFKDDERYSGEGIFSIKAIYVNADISNDEGIKKDTYVLNSGCFLLNENGKTIDRL